jgi:hypothetical protein
MRPGIIFISLLLYVQSWSQNNNQIEDLQIKNFNRAKDFLKDSNLNGAMNSFYNATRFNPKTQIGALSLKKADSIKIILRKNLINELTGNWRMIDDVPTWVMREDSIVGQMLKINTSEIQFFELIRNAKNWKLAKTEKILYSDQFSESSSYTDLIYSNNEIWHYWIDEKTGYLNLTNTGAKTEKGRTDIACGALKRTYFKLQ